MVGPESRTTRDGQTSRDIYPEDEGQPEIQQDDVPTQQFNEDPQFAPLPDEQPRATVDWGTTAFEQSQGEPADVRLDREVPTPATTCGRPRTRTGGTRSSSRT